MQVSKNHQANPLTYILTILEYIKTSLNVIWLNIVVHIPLTK
jgi:hypothetical protein